MKTVNYLKKTAKNLFECTHKNGGSKFYVKIFVNEEDNTYRVLRLNEEFEVTKDTTRNIPEDWVTTTGKVLSSVDISTIIGWYDYPYVNVRSIKHFKKIRNIMEEHLSKELVVS